MTTYEVTGVLTNGRRFKRMTFTSYMHAMGINLYRGSVWAREGNGPRKLVRRVWN